MNNKIILQKLYKYCLKLTDYCSDYTYESFAADLKLVEACVFNLSQMGELCHLADKSMTKEYPQIPWSAMYGLRNRIVHDYEGVNLRLVWEIISEDIPILKTTLEILEKQTNSEE